MKEITVIDSIKRSGKTSWIMHYISKAPMYEKFVYIVQDEKKASLMLNSQIRHFKRVDEQSSLQQLKSLFANGENIIGTQQPFQYLDDECYELLAMQNYTLILDEVKNTLHPVNISPDDINLLLQNNVVSVRDKGRISWDAAFYMDGYFTDMKTLATSNRLMLYQNEQEHHELVYWTFPKKFYEPFENCYLLTYMFDGQLQKSLFELYEFKYKKYSISFEDNEYKLVDYILSEEEDRSLYKKLIHIYYPMSSDKNDLNKIGSQQKAFTFFDLQKKMNSIEIINVIRESCYDFYRKKCKAEPDDVMWTTYPKMKEKLTPRGLNHSFVSFYKKENDHFSHKSCCLYLSHPEVNTSIKQFFENKGIVINEDLYSLHHLIEWMFQSRLQQKQPINVFIPSIKMRALLEKYLNNEI